VTAQPSLVRATESLRSRLTRLWSSRRFRLVVRALALGWILFFWLWLIGAQSNFGEVDAEAYWGFTLDELYRDVQLGDQDAFLYSPVVAYLFLPFSALPWEVFYAILAAVNLVALVWILRPELAALSLFLVPVSNEVARGNIHILIAAAIVLGFHYYGTWAWVILTKVTPGIGVLWFAVRREWRSFAIALGVTGAIVAVSFVLTPDLWSRWFAVLTASVEVTRPSVIEIPVLPRLAVAAILIAIAARRSWYALVPVACMLALPAIWVNSLAMLVAVVPLWRYSTSHRPAPGPSESASLSEEGQYFRVP
jgi:hypothetical protein